MKKFATNFCLSTDNVPDDINEANFVKKLLGKDDTNRLALAVVLQIAIDNDLEFDFESDGNDFSDKCIENLTLFVQQHIDVMEFNETFLATIHTIALMDKKNVNGMLINYQTFIKDHKDV